jgi:hypothetical protein
MVVCLLDVHMCQGKDISTYLRRSDFPLMCLTCSRQALDLVYQGTVRQPTHVPNLDFTHFVLDTSRAFGVEARLGGREWRASV